VISPVRQEELHARHEKNAVRLELGKEPDPYSSAEKAWREWLEDGTLLRDSDPAVYFLSQTFRARTGETVRRSGFLALCELEGPERGKILPHEKTFPKAKEDRLRLLSQTKAQFSPIFSLYSDDSGAAQRVFRKVSATAPLLRAELDGVLHEVWKVADKEVLQTLQDVLQRTEVFIADGHHRYETALEYQRMQRALNPRHSGSEGYNYTLMYFTNVLGEGLVIYPIHRVIRGLKHWTPDHLSSLMSGAFRLHPLESVGELLSTLGKSVGEVAYGLIVQGDARCYLMTLSKSSSVDEKLTVDVPPQLSELDVVKLHTHVIPRIVAVDSRGPRDPVHIDFVPDEAEAVRAVQSGAAQVAILLNPVAIEQLTAVARAGLTMPPKSTFFYPKLPAGLIMYDLEHGLSLE